MNARYRLQRKEAYHMPNILGNHSLPVVTNRWKDILASDDKEALEDYMIEDGNHRIIDTREEVDSVCGAKMDKVGNNE